MKYYITFLKSMFSDILDFKMNITYDRCPNKFWKGKVKKSYETLEIVKKSAQLKSDLHCSSK